MDCGGGGISGGCRLLQVIFSVQTCRFVKLSVCTFIVVVHYYMCMEGLAFRRSWGWRCNLRPGSRGLDESPLLYTSLVSTPPAFEKIVAARGGE